MSRDPPLVEPRSAGLIDRAETFSEPSLTLDGRAIAVNNESTGIEDGVEDSDTNNTGLSPQDEVGTSDKTGLVVQVKEPFDSITANVYNLAGATEAYLIDHADGTVLDQVSITDSDISITWSGGPWGSGEYRLVADDSGGSYSSYNDIDASFPYTSTYIDVEHGYIGGESVNLYNFHEVSVSTTNPLDGTAYVGWEHPPDIYRWDSVLFQRTRDGETVTVDVQESTDGGSTWTPIATDVSRGQEITADPSSEVRLKVNLSRNDTANNPTLDAAYRRYVV